jgi:hypothetical protein
MGDVLSSQSTDYYALSDALAIKVKIDWESFSFEAWGDVKADFGFFKSTISLLAVSYIMDVGEGKVSFILNSTAGKLAFYVEYDVYKKLTSAFLLNGNSLPNQGDFLFEKKTVLDVASGRALLFDSLKIDKLDGYETTVNGPWRAICLKNEKSSSGAASKAKTGPTASTAGFPS